jgi:hypothetical protein
MASGTLLPLFLKYLNKLFRGTESPLLPVDNFDPIQFSGGAIRLSITPKAGGCQSPE